MAASDPTDVGSETRREDLLRLGIELFTSHPYDEVSVDDIAAAGGISKGLLYHYFPSKRDFYVAVIRAATDELRTLTQPDPALPPIEQLRQSLDAYLEYAEHHAEAYTTVLHGGVGRDPEVRQIVDELRHLNVERVAVGIATRMRPALRAVLYGWTGFVEEASMDWLAHRDLAREEVVAAAVHALSCALRVAREIDAELDLDLPLATALEARA